MTVLLPKYHAQLQHWPKHVCKRRKTLDKYMDKCSIKYDGQNFVSLLHFVYTQSMPCTLFWLFSSHTQSVDQTQEMATISHFSQSLWFVWTTISACISKKKTQFSKLYLCNCPEKMVKKKKGFALLPCLPSLCFCTGKTNLQGIPLCQLKYGEGNNTQSPRMALSIVNASLRRRHVKHTHRGYGFVILLTTCRTQW